MPRQFKMRIWANGDMGTAEAMKMVAPDGVEDPKIMFSTGAVDPTGKEIYEGDIAERICLDKECEPVHRGEVVFVPEAGAYFLHNESKGENYPMILSINGGQTYITPTVLGNKYQNPDLQ